jgi:hypothetical protein
MTDHLESVEVEQCEAQAEAGVATLGSKHLLQRSRREYGTVQASTVRKKRAEKTPLVNDGRVHMPAGPVPSSNVGARKIFPS